MRSEESLSAKDQIDLWGNASAEISGMQDDVRLLQEKIRKANEAESAFLLQFLERVGPAVLRVRNDILALVMPRVLREKGITYASYFGPKHLDHVNFYTARAPYTGKPIHLERYSDYILMDLNQQWTEENFAEHADWLQQLLTDIDEESPH